MDEVPREHFVAPEFTESAYADHALPIACGQTISQPYVVAYMTEQLQVGPQHRVLEVGTGSGYQAAILSRLAREVVSVERYRTLAETARQRLRTLGYANVTIIVGDGFAGAPEQAPFDRIIVTAAAENIPPALVEQLGANGKIVLPLGPRNSTQHIVKLTKTAGGALERENLIAVRFVPLLPGQAREL
jgi:protein-L-isoaspartate(D-aspartate) O-methyltransferase